MKTISKVKLQEIVLEGASRYNGHEKEFSSATIMTACRIVYEITKLNPTADFDELFGNSIHLEDFIRVNKGKHD